MTKFAFGEFVDYKGLTHKIVVASVIAKCNNGTYLDSMSWDYSEDNPLYDDVNFVKGISIGISICNPEDTYVESLGKVRAEGRALKPRGKGNLIVGTKRLITPYVAEAIAKSVVQDIELNPGKFIDGYNDEEKKWKKLQNIPSQVPSVS